MLTKLQVLEAIDKNEVIGPRELANYFGQRYNWGKERINRLHKEGLIELLSIERGRWILTNAGIERLDYLRRKRDVKRG